ncbi:GlsB/YeaQ/YmgE family stress response membrane protein [Pelotalea chapellei]|uniref:GlsB/YeaQ/YmgE family stress response membrane protein n=1 Tax=Pelotalea chapellei TaxID=44671 RepID=A0ABS5U4C3_9BACT|nr:GlsB/YeaQ/YmgE family stress response membrane protein [Pelotalea chapellei]MBT1070516.1 GlsB/YeaQ/YmgE family stress response membrane protein [Pelotalea chapellei]
MGIISWIVMGLIVGALAKFIMPGRDPGGFFITILLGIAGAFLGGFIGSVLGLGDVTGFNIGSLLLAIGGSILLLVIYRALKGRGAVHT